MSSEAERIIRALLAEQQLDFAQVGGVYTDITCIPLDGDGSSRAFFRMMYKDRSIGIAVLPPSAGERDWAEFQSAVAIGNHLYHAGMAVPQILGVAEASGVILFEDMGDTRLHDVIRFNRSRALGFYRMAVHELASLQVQGARNFNTAWCYDTPVYDETVMLERESGYFISAFWQGLLHQSIPSGLVEEFEAIAAQVVQNSQLFFLHRDYQSRNIMIRDERVTIIDFQAGRLGPPAYDLASLLIDPYARLSEGEQTLLFDQYLKAMESFAEVNLEKLIRSYPYLALQRNLQIIGAFSFLYKQCNKPFFKPFILPAVQLLQNRLKMDQFIPYPVLKMTAIEAFERCRQHFNG